MLRRLIVAGLVFAASSTAADQQGATFVAYGVLLDQHCGTHEAAAVAALLYEHSQFTEDEKKNAFVTVEQQYLSAGNARFCFAIKRLFKKVFRREVD